MAAQVFQPLPLSRRPAPFSHADWLFEIKYDGFRALCYIDIGRVRLVSRNGNEFASFGTLRDGVAKELRDSEAILDGEIASRRLCPPTREFRRLRWTLAVLKLKRGRGDFSRTWRRS